MATMSERADTLFVGARLATMAGGYGIVDDGAVAVRDGRIAWVGPRGEAPAADRQNDCGGLWLTPGLVDCHTHIVHAGNRSDEWEARLNGASYEDIARQGGGIMSTVRATRAAGEDDLLRQSAARIEALLAEGESLELCSDHQRINMVRYDAVLLDQDTTWTLQAGQGMIFIADIHYYDGEEELEDEDGHYE